MGLTSDQESEEVESYVRKYPELLVELHAIQDALLNYNLSYSKEPLHNLEHSILGKIDALPATPSAPLPSAPKPMAGADQKYKKAIGLAGIALLAALASLFYLFQQNRQTKKALADTMSQMEQLRSDCEAIRNSNAKMADYINKVGDPNSKAVVMKGLEPAPNAVAVVHWNQVKKEAFIEVKDLPPAPKGKQYQLWAIVNGKPTDMGVFTLQAGDNELKSVPFIASPQAFAVTLEDEGGSPVPTLDQMYLLGNV